MTCNTCETLALELQLSNNDRFPQNLVLEAYDRLKEHRGNHNANELCSICNRAFGDRSHTINNCFKRSVGYTK